MAAHHQLKIARPGATAERARRPLVELGRYWGVVIAWMLCISTLSTDPFSAANTHRYLDPILRYFIPDLTAEQFQLAHWGIRKTAHFVEFFILGLLAYWAFRRGRTPRWRLRWMMQALAFAALYSLLDEAHQAFVPSRSPSLVDSGIDSLGAAISQAVIYGRYAVGSRFAFLTEK
jgi:VanZ family protein